MEALDRFVGVAGSLLVHATLLLSMLVPPAPPPIVPVKARAQRGGNDIAIRLLPSPKGDGLGLACAKSYRGVGIEHGFTGYIREVVAGGPADKAGVRVGDWLLNGDSLTRDGYSIGRVVVLKVERDRQLLNLPVRIDRICYAEGQEP